MASCQLFPLLLLLLLLLPMVAGTLSAYETPDSGNTRQDNLDSFFYNDHEGDTERATRTVHHSQYVESPMDKCRHDPTWRITADYDECLELTGWDPLQSRWWKGDSHGIDTNVGLVGQRHLSSCLTKQFRYAYNTQPWGRYVSTRSWDRYTVLSLSLSFLMRLAAVFVPS